MAANLALGVRIVAGEGTPAEVAISRRTSGVSSTAAEVACHRLALSGQTRRLHLKQALDLLVALRSLAKASTAQGLEDHALDAIRAANIRFGWPATGRRHP